MTPPVPRPRATVEGLLATATERVRHARLALRHHRTAALAIGRAALAEDERLVAVIAAIQGEIDGLLDELIHP